MEDEVQQKTYRPGNNGPVILAQSHLQNVKAVQWANLIQAEQSSFNRFLLDNSFVEVVVEETKQEM